MDGLDERKRKILNAIIQTYLETGEPVGSRTLSKCEGINLSSATIRNEMSDLEDLGYIVQPHTSAGRIPSDKGYRLYVDSLMKDKEEEVSQMQELMIQKQDRMDHTLKKMARMLAENTNYAAMISSPQAYHSRVKFIQLSQMDEFHVVAVIVLEGNVVRNRIISVSEPLNNEGLLKLNILLNSQLVGQSLGEINLGIISQMKTQAGIHSTLVDEVLDAVAQALKAGEEVEIYTSGATNIFKYPELSDRQRAQNLIGTLEEKNQLAELVTKVMEDTQETGMRVYIGQEAPVQSMKDCSVVTATYDMGNGMQGTIGIIGPKRMDYENVMNNMKKLMQQLDQVFNNGESNRR